MEDWAEICRLHRAEGMAIRAIARRLEISRNAVKKAVTSHEPPRYVRAAAGSAFAIVQSYLSTAAKWGISKLDALRDLFNNNAWIPSGLEPAR